MLHRVYLNMVTARLLTNCSNTLRNIHTNARENITRTRAKRKAGYFFVAHSVHTHTVGHEYTQIRTGPNIRERSYCLNRVVSVAAVTTPNFQFTVCNL